MCRHGVSEAAPGGKGQKDLETAPLARAVCMEGLETPGAGAGSGNPGATQKTDPQAGPVRMRNATRFQGPRRDVNLEPQRPRPRARACAPGPGPGGLALRPAPAAAAHRAGCRVRPLPCLRPGARPRLPPTRRLTSAPRPVRSGQRGLLAPGQHQPRLGASP